MKKIRPFFLLCLFVIKNTVANAEVVGGSCGDNAKWSLDTTTGLLSITGIGS